MTESNNILVTGFGPFRDHKVNASWEAVSALPDEIKGFKILKQEIPVSYEYVEKNIPLLWNLYNPKLVVHVGVSSFTQKIQIETCAHSTGYTSEDIENRCPANGSASCSIEDPTDCIHTNLDTNAISSRLNEFPTLCASTSNNPGRYLCEFIYYTSLKIDNNRSLFIHVPPIDKPFSKNQLTYALEEIIKCGLDLIEKNSESLLSSPTQTTTIYKNGRAATF